MVLGVLALMLVLAVAFAISMRTERLAAGNYADSVRARRLVHVGLVRAMDDICRIMGTNLASGGLVYPPWSVTNSYATKLTNTTNIAILCAELGPGGRIWTKLYTNNNTILTTTADSATNFVPQALWSAATNADNLDPSNHWVEIWSGVTDTSVDEAKLSGRVSYLILNCSGLLDANFVGGNGIARQYGTNPTEIAVSLLGELPVGFFTNRNTDVRYESLEELAALNYFQSTNFCVDSRCLPGYWATNPAPGTIRTQVNLAGGRAEIGSRSSIIFDALSEIGFVDPERGNIYRNLLDYVDTDSNLESSSVESVPMINEMIYNITATPGAPPTYDIVGRATFELWYPFVNGGGTYTFSGNVAFRSTAGAGTLNISITTNIVVTTQSFAVISFNGATNLAIAPVSFDISNIVAEVSSGTNVCDQLTPCRVVAGVVGNGIDVGWACLDPRFNRDPDNPNLWRQDASITLSNINTWTASYLLTNYDGDMDTKMYVANTNLRSVAELGYLAYSSNEPWHTIKLYGTNLHRVLDVFAIGTNVTDTHVTHTRRGLVNPSSRETNALAAVFANMPVDEYPGGPSNRLSQFTWAQDVAKRVYDSDYLRNTNTFTNLSAIGYALTNFNDLGVGAGAVKFDTELKRESLFRNACGLLSVRQNLFTIIIEAQVASGGILPRNAARQRAVAIVWRDPYTGEFVVRSFQWLED